MKSPHSETLATLARIAAAKAPKKTVDRPIPAADRPAGDRGNMKQEEIRPLVKAARQAYDRQREFGLHDGENFDTWRHRIVKEVTGKDGLTKLDHVDYCPVLAHFQLLAGLESEAFKTQMRSGRARGQSPIEDTHENRRNVVHQILTTLRAHADNGGKIREGYLVSLVRQKTSRPDLHLGSDLRAGLADRCTVKQLSQILYTLTNRIAAAEGNGTTWTRNKSQRQTKKSQSKGHMDDPRW